MIVSHELRLIFIKTKKTASTSVEVALSEFCGPEDILTPISEEYLRRRPGFRNAQHFRGDSPDGRPQYRPHIPAREVIERVGRELWDDYLTVAVDRNPWDKVVSFYFFNTRNMGPRPPFAAWVASGGAVGLGGMSSYCVGDQIAVDRVCRFERLEFEMVVLARLLKLPRVPKLPRAKGDIRPQGLAYQDLYDPESKKIVAETYAREIEYFGYKF